MVNERSGIRRKLPIDCQVETRVPEPLPIPLRLSFESSPDQPRAQVTFRPFGEY
jgi:hypothetical protein